MKEKLIELAKVHKNFPIENNLSMHLHDIKESEVPLDYFKEDKEGVPNVDDKIFKSIHGKPFDITIFVPNKD